MPTPSSRGSSSKQLVTALVSAATKALLDAGLTFDDVSRGVTSVQNKESRVEAQAFKAFDPSEISIDVVKHGLELQSAMNQVQDRGTQCVLAISLQKSSAIALLLISEDFLWRYPYLKDSSTLLRKLDMKSGDSKSHREIQLDELCRQVWTYRGWSKPRDSSGQREVTFRVAHSDHSFQLSRSDGQDPPSWEDVEHRQDGKHRLGYNPAVETREISYEDFEAVRAERSKGDKGDGNPRFKQKGGDRAALAKL